MKRFCNDFAHAVDEYETLLTENRIWVGRTKGIGILTAEDAIALGVTGPVLRASGVKWDLRKAQPYAAYDQYEFDIPTRRNRRHLRSLHRAHGRDAPVAADLPAGHREYSHRPDHGGIGKVLKPPPGEVYHSIEAPKGELGYYIVSDGTTQPYRVRVRPPSFINLQAFRQNGAGRAGGGRGGDHRHD